MSEETPRHDLVQAPFRKGQIRTVEEFRRIPVGTKLVMHYSHVPRFNAQEIVFEGMADEGRFNYRSIYHGAPTDWVSQQFFTDSGILPYDWPKGKCWNMTNWVGYLPDDPRFEDADYFRFFQPGLYRTEMNRLVMIEHVTRFDRDFELVGRLWLAHSGLATWSTVWTWRPDGHRKIDGYVDTDVQYKLKTEWRGSLPKKCGVPLSFVISPGVKELA